MAAFPTLTAKPIYPLDPDGTLDDAAIRSDYTAGYEQARPKFTRAQRSFGVRYTLDNTDTATLRSFELTTLANGADSFTWTHPISATTYTVRLTAPIRYIRQLPGITDVQFVVREV
jgi:phage-related protein